MSPTATDGAEVSKLTVSAAVTDVTMVPMLIARCASGDQLAARPFAPTLTATAKLGDVANGVPSATARRGAEVAMHGVEIKRLLAV